MTPDTHQARMVILRGDDCISRGDDPPYPPLSARPGLIAKAAVVSGPPMRTVIPWWEAPLYPKVNARPGLIAKAAVVSGPPARTVILREGAPLYPKVSWVMPSQGPAR